MFVNCSNHPSLLWENKQMEEASKWGTIVDYPFPYVDAQAGERDIEILAQKTVEALAKMKPDAVMCQGEFTLTYAIVSKLKEMNIEAVSACSERKTTEYKLETGEAEKVSQFDFVRFRRY